jgi:hypothetical protein
MNMDTDMQQGWRERRGERTRARRGRSLGTAAVGCGHVAERRPRAPACIMSSSMRSHSAIGPSLPALRSGSDTGQEKSVSQSVAFAGVSVRDGLHSGPHHGLTLGEALGWRLHPR